MSDDGEKRSATIVVRGGGKVTIEDSVSTADEFIVNEGGTVKSRRNTWHGKRLPDEG